MGELARKLLRLINSQAEINVEEARLRPNRSEVERLLGDNSKLKKLTGWAPDITIDEGLRYTIQWFENKDNFARYKTNIYNM